MATKKRVKKKTKVVAQEVVPPPTQRLYIGHVITETPEQQSGSTYLRFAASSAEAVGLMLTSASNSRPGEAIVSHGVDLCPESIIRKAALLLGMKE